MQPRKNFASFVPKPPTSVITQDVFGELLIYDLERNIVRRLNPIAAAIWKQCDGHRNVAQIMRSVRPQFEGQVDEQLVILALYRFSRAHLLEAPVPRLQHERRVSRREWIKRIGIAALPIVTSMTVPTSAQAASCLPLGSLCSSNGQCCSHNCIFVAGMGLICQ